MNELYELPDGWEWKILSDTVDNPKQDIVDGPFGSNLKASEYTDKGTPIIRLQNIDRFNFIEKDIKYITDEKAKQLKRHNFCKGDLVITKLGSPLGKCCTVPSDRKYGIIVADVVRVRINEERNIKKFIEYFINSTSAIEQLQSHTKGATRPRVNLTHIRGLNIPLPSFREQKRIVSKLDRFFEKIDKAIALHQKNMDEADVFMGSVLSEIFEELEKKYGLIKIDDIVVKTKNKNPMDEKNKPFTYIDISSIDNKSFKIIEPKQLIGSEAPSRAKKEVLFGDVLYSTTRPNLKNIAIINDEYDNPIASTGFCVLRINDKTINSYLFYYLVTEKLFKQIEPNIRGAQYPATSDKDLKNCNIPNTPLQIQQKVVNYLDEISEKTEKVKSIQKEKMDSLKALKASILDKAFRGEL